MDRTRGLEKRAVLLKATSDVGRAITSSAILPSCSSKITLVIYDYFGYYHVGIFCSIKNRICGAHCHKQRRRPEDAGKKSPPESRRNRHRWICNQHRPGAHRTGRWQDAVYFDNPDLPNTRSEMALRWSPVHRSSVPWTCKALNHRRSPKKIFPPCRLLLI